MSFWKRWNKKGGRKPLWIAGMAIGVLFLFLGCRDGQLEEIYSKAVMICLECIGIG